MTSETDRHDQPTDNSTSEQCMLYLLGELNDEQANGFENQLANSSQLRDELLSQSSILCALSENESVAPTTLDRSLLRIASVLAALAACLMIAFPELLHWLRTEVRTWNSIGGKTH